MRRRLPLFLLGVAAIVGIALLIRSARNPGPSPVPPEEVAQTEPDDPLDVPEPDADPLDAPPAPPAPPDLSKSTS